MMQNFAGIEKFFTYMALKNLVRLAYSCQKQFSPREILNAKAPGAGRRVKVEAEGIPRNDLDATTGDIP